MEIKLIATDLDGTFFDNDHITIPQRNIDAFKAAHDIGVKTAVASGRTKILTDDILNQLPFLDYLVTSNGAVTYDIQNNCVVSTKLIENSQTLKIFQILDSHGIPFEIYFDGKCYASKESYKKYEEKNLQPIFLYVLKEFTTAVDDLSALIGNRGIEKINAMNLTAKEREMLENELRKTGEIYITSSFSDNLEMNNYYANKGFALRSLADALGINSDNVMCFGDGENDCEMLSFAKYSFAMENGSDYAKNSAKFITAPNYRCGVAQAIEKYVLGK